MASIAKRNQLAACGHTYIVLPLVVVSSHWVCLSLAIGCHLLLASICGCAIGSISLCLSSFLSLPFPVTTANYSLLNFSK